MVEGAKVTIEAELKGLDEATEKLDSYIKLLEKAKTLADELASTTFEINVKEN